MALKAKEWAPIDADFLTGNFTRAAICKKYGLCRGTFDKRIKKKGLIKGKLIPAIEKKVQEKTVDHFARLGFSPDDAIKKLMECITDAKRTVFEGKGEQMIATPEADWKIILQALDQYNKLAGTYAPTKTEVNIKATMELISVKVAKIAGIIAREVPFDKREGIINEVDAIWEEVEE